MGEEEEEKDILASTEIVTSKGGNQRRNSTGQPIMNVPLTSSNGYEKVLPHYLRASTGSCHDLCKYGRKHAFEAKGKHSIQRKLPRDAESLLGDEDHIKQINVVDRKKKLLLKSKDAPELNFESDNSKITRHETLQSVKKSEITDPMVASLQDSMITESLSTSIPSKTLNVSSSPNSPSDKLDRVNGRKTGKRTVKILSGGKSRRSNEGSASQSLSAPSGQRNGENRSSNVVGINLTAKRNSEKSEISTDPMVASLQDCEITKPFSTSIPSIVLNGKSSSPNSPSNELDVVNGRKSAEKSVKILSGGKSARRSNDGSASQSLSAPSDQRNSENPSSRMSGGNRTVKRNSENRMKNVGGSIVGEKKMLKLAVVSSLAKPPVKRVPSIKPIGYGGSTLVSSKLSRNEVKKSEPSNQQTAVKTLYVVEPKIEERNLESVGHDENVNKSSHSSLFLGSYSSCPSLSSDEEEFDEALESEHMEVHIAAYKNDKSWKNDAEGLKLVDKRRTGRIALVHTEDKNSVPQKLKFQRGKVINLEPEKSGTMGLKFKPSRVETEKCIEPENSGMKRLKFRQGRLLGLSLSGKSRSGRRSFRRNRDMVSSEMNTSNARATLVLRHQDIQRKKEEQVLFNDVIEETANKLVETRKSKVKALVCAFETVISLQESKPVATIVFGTMVCRKIIPRNS